MASTASSSKDGPSRKHMERSQSTVSPMLPSSFNGSWSEAVKICLGIKLVVVLSILCSLWCAHMILLKPLCSSFFFTNGSRFAVKVLSFFFFFGVPCACLNLGKLSLMHQWLCCCRPSVIDITAFIRGRGSFWCRNITFKYKCIQHQSLQDAGSAHETVWTCNFAGSVAIGM